MDMSTAPIRLRDKPEDLRVRLGLSNQRWENFKNFARRAHNEYMETHPRSHWADPRVTWTALPEEEMVAVTAIMYTLVRNATLFPAAYSQQRIREGITARLYAVRRTWVQGQPR